MGTASPEGQATGQGGRCRRGEAGVKALSPEPEQARQQNALDGHGEEKEESFADPLENNGRADFLVRGCWSLNTDCLVDFVVTDVKQPSYRLRKPEAVLR